jgi:hypothetical protein
MKNIRNQCVRANLENKVKMLKIMLSNCELKGVNTSFYWNKPFDILFELGKTENRGHLGVRLTGLGFAMGSGFVIIGQFGLNYLL